MKRPEEALQRAITDYLDASLPSSAWWCAIPNGGGRSKAEAGILKATGVKAGAPDLIIVWDGIFFGIELKAPSGRLSDNQKAACDMIVRAGGFYTVIRSLDELEVYLIAQGVPMRGRLAA